MEVSFYGFFLSSHAENFSFCMTEMIVQDESANRVVWNWSHKAPVSSVIDVFDADGTFAEVGKILLFGILL